MSKSYKADEQEKLINIDQSVNNWVPNYLQKANGASVLANFILMREDNKGYRFRALRFSDHYSSKYGPCPLDQYAHNNMQAIDVYSPFYPSNLSIKIAIKYFISVRLCGNLLHCSNPIDLTKQRSN